MEQYKHKEEIRMTRVGALGGSDAELIAQVAKLGYVPKSAYKRMAVCRGILKQEDITNAAMRFGNFVEDNVYQMLVGKDNEYQSNPLWESKKYSKRNVKLICHPDIVRYDYDNKILYVYECKATKYGVKATKETYRGQLFIEWELAHEIIKELDGDWKVKLALCHYDANEVDLDKDFEIDTNRLTITNVAFNGTGSRMFIDIDKAMNIISDFLDTFNEYYSEDEIDSKYLPENVQQEFSVITNILTEIKEREKKVEEFKDRLYQFMLDKEIKSIKNDQWTIVRVDESESKSFDGKKYIEDYIAAHPYKGRKLYKEYEKTIERKGSVQIRLKNRNKNS